MERCSEGTRKETAMWGFKQKPARVGLSKKLALHLAKERGLSDGAAASLGVLEKSGRYDGRRVTTFRVYDPAKVGAAGAKPLSFGDLHAGTILYSGHIEKDGHIVLFR